MRKVAASMQHVNGSSSASSLHFATDVGSSIYSDGASFITGNGAGSHIMMGPSGTTAVGNALMGSDGSGVSCITFEQHSQLVRYPNSMSNLRRLRCYLLACQVFGPNTAPLPKNVLSSWTSILSRSCP